MNQLIPGNSNLHSVDYSDLLAQILRVLQKQNPFLLTQNRQQLFIDVDTVADQVARQNIENPLGSGIGVRSASINFSNSFRDQFPDKIHQLQAILLKKISEKIASSENSDQSLSALLARLTTPVEEFDQEIDEIGFNYPLSQSVQRLKKQRLTTQRQFRNQQTPVSGSQSILKFHKLAIAVQNIHQFEPSLKQGITAYIEQRFPDPGDQQELKSILEDLIHDENSDFHLLKRIVDTETLGQLKKEARITYLEYLLENIDNSHQDTVYLRDLIRRLRLINDYISDRTKDDDFYTVHYAGVTVNYRDIFSRAEAFDALPIIPIVTGNLGETTNRDGGEREFIFGLKLKLGGSVQTSQGETVFDYNLKLIDPDSKEHQEQLNNDPYFAARVLKRAFLYYFIFASRSNPQDQEYHPDSELEYYPHQKFEAVRQLLQSSDEEGKRNFFRKLVKGLKKYNVFTKIKRLKELLKKILSQATILPPKSYSRFIQIKQGILQPDINSWFNGNCFQDVLKNNPKESLRYISINQPNIEASAICQLPAKITFEDIRYFHAGEEEELKIRYNIDGVQLLPMLWVPKDEVSRNSYTKYFKRTKLVGFSYEPKRLSPGNYTPQQAFVYQITASLLTYICLHILLEKAPQNLFIAILRLHVGDENNPLPCEKFMAQLSKILCHLLGEKHRLNSQGIRLNKPIKELKKFKIPNSLTSLYSALPRQFRLISNTTNLDKLAIIIVSSLESDAMLSNRDKSDRIITLFGEVVSIQRFSNGLIQVEKLKTFSDNSPSHRLYTNPVVLTDTIANLYDQGYRHFFYVAKAPYSSNLNLTRNDDEQLFFMSRQLLQSVKTPHSDIKIYPVFFDKYYVRKSNKLNLPTSFYIKETAELLELLEDPSQKSVVFFNLFNGISVGPNDERFYNGVVSYETLLNIYGGILDDRDIWTGLIDDQSALKHDLLEYVTLFHFSQTERNNHKSLKLDPYDHIIGDNSVAKQSVFPHMNEQINFNTLAFLIEVKKVLNTPEK